MEKQYAQAVADRDTWREVAHASQGASSSSQRLEDMMGNQLEEEIVAARNEAEFWKATLNAQELKKKDQKKRRQCMQKARLNYGSTKTQIRRTS